MMSASKFESPFLRMALCALPLAWLWWVLINDLRVEWTVNPQYGYGWAVPFFCALLLARNARFAAAKQNRKPEARSQNGLRKFLRSAFGSMVLPISLALLYLPSRLIQEANPDWRLVGWTLAIEVIGLTLWLLHLTIHDSQFTIGKFSFQFSTFVFPLCFFLVAVPWPSLVEMPIIQSLTRMDVRATTELMGWLGIPAIPHGNVIEVATGIVGIDEACSGIRSFQATLMISLFLGEWLRMTLGRRMTLVLAGFLLSLLFNLSRLMLLVWVGAHDGLATMSRWHDPAGIMILLGCFFGLWFLAHGLAARPQGTETRSQKPEALPTETSDFRLPISAGLVLSAWLVLVETGVETWYRIHESRLPAAVTWSIAWPANPTMKEVPLGIDARRVLRFDENQSRRWQADGLLWQAVFLRWEPGSVAARLTANHTPEVCLSCAGYHFTGQSGLQTLTAHGLQLPFRFYQVGDTVPPVFVAYCLWEDRAKRREFSTALLSYGNRLAPVLIGQRNAGQRSLEIALTGVNDLASAQTAVQQLLEKILFTGR